MKSILVVVSLISPSALADELESVFTQKVQTQESRNSSYLADTIRGILGSTNAEQNHFLRLVEESKWAEALYQFKPAFDNNFFQTSENGQALRALLMFRSGLAVQGLEELTEIKSPEKINFQILNQWRESADIKHPAWMAARLNWKKGWTDVFGVAAEVKVKSADLSLAKDPALLKELAKIASPDSRERALLDWNLAIQYASKDEVKESALIISGLMKAKNNPIPEDLLNLTAARLLYQNAYFEAAQKYYDKVPKSSDYFFDAQEEKSWAALKLRKPQDALAITQTLVNPVFSGQIGPETWFVRSLAQLKVCDYASALETLKGFPGEFKARTVELQKLSNDSNTPEVAKALTEIENDKLTLRDLVMISRNLPRGMVKDEILRQLVRNQKTLAEESKTLDVMTASMVDVGVRSEFEGLKNSMAQRAQQAKSNTLGRVKKLAEIELNETKSILQKLHIVEAEIIQQVENATRVAKNAIDTGDVKKGSTGSSLQDVLKFPFDKEFWFDELTNYKVDLKKACQAKKAL